MQAFFLAPEPVYSQILKLWTARVRLAKIEAGADPAVLHRPFAMSFDAYLDKVQNLIKTHGWAIQGVGSTPAFFYTVGLAARHSLPEIVVMGLPFRVAQDILNKLAQRLVEGKLVLKEGELYGDVFEGFQARFVKLTPVQVVEHLRVACVFAQDTPQAWQLIWPDPQGKFEGDKDVDPSFVAMQNLALTATDTPN